MFGDLENSWVKEDPNGGLTASTGKRYTRCDAVLPAGAGCNRADHQNSDVDKVNGYKESSWFSGGSKPALFPWIAVPQLGLRFKPIKEFVARLGAHAGGRGRLDVAGDEADAHVVGLDPEQIFGVMRDGAQKLRDLGRVLARPEQVPALFDQRLGQRIEEPAAWQRVKRLGCGSADIAGGILHRLAIEPGMLGAIFFKAQNKIQDPAKLARLVQMIDAKSWIGLDADTKGDLYEGLLQKNAETKSGAGQYFTPRAIIQAMVACVRPQPEKTVADPACGTGGFFLTANEWLSGSGQWLKDNAAWLHRDLLKLNPDRKSVV